jgi:hypothetical protein
MKHVAYVYLLIQHRLGDWRKNLVPSTQHGPQAGGSTGPVWEHSKEMIDRFSSPQALALPRSVNHRLSRSRNFEHKAELRLKHGNWQEVDVSSIVEDTSWC